MEILSQHWFQVQEVLFPHLKKEMGIMSSNHERLVTVIELSEVRSFIKRIYPNFSTGGRPCSDRHCIAISFLAKQIFNLPTTRSLIDRLHCDEILRRLCGFERKKEIPSEATFSRVFKEFSDLDITRKLLDLLIIKHHSSRIIGHVSRDATEIDGREKAFKKPKKKKQETFRKKKKGRPKKGEESLKIDPQPKRLEKQQTQTLQEMMDDLPKYCDVGSKVNSQGYKISWTGYKLHIDTIDGDIPVSAILTSASIHDSQVALPLSKMTQSKITVLYEVMDAAYDAAIIRQSISQKGHVPLIDFNRRSPKDQRKFEDFEQERYKVRSGAERVNSHLKDNLGGRTIRVRGHEKVLTHLGFGLLIMAVEQTLRLLT
jgi:hypothetical protein